MSEKGETTCTQVWRQEKARNVWHEECWVGGKMGWQIWLEKEAGQDDKAHLILNTIMDNKHYYYLNVTSIFPFESLCGLLNNVYKTCLLSCPPPTCCFCRSLWFSKQHLHIFSCSSLSHSLFLSFPHIMYLNCQLILLIFHWNYAQHSAFLMTPCSSLLSPPV